MNERELGRRKEELNEADSRIVSTHHHPSVFLAYAFLRHRIRIHCHLHMSTCCVRIFINNACIAIVFVG